MPTTVAVVGIGGYGAFYLEELLRASPERDVRLVAGIDPEPERCPMLAELEESGARLFADLEAFYRSESADLVILAAPIHLHAPLTCLALSHGSSVLCEKPLSGSLEDARMMLAAEKQSGKTVAIGYQWSFCDPVLALKRDVQAGRFGRPLGMKTLVLWPRTRAYYRRNDWAGKIHAAEGDWVLDSPVNNATAHYLHNMLFLLGSRVDTCIRPTRVQAELYRANPIENYDTGALRVATQGGPDLLFLTTHAVNVERGPVAAYVFEDAVIEYPGDNSERREFIVRFRNGTVENYGDPEDTVANKIWQTVDAARTGQPVVCGIRTALPQLACALGAQETGIHNFPPGMVRVEDESGDPLTWADGLAETFTAAFETGQLPAEIGSAGWAVKSPNVDLAKYLEDLE